MPVDNVREAAAGERPRRLVRHVEAVGQQPRKTALGLHLLQDVHP